MIFCFGRIFCRSVFPSCRENGNAKRNEKKECGNVAGTVHADTFETICSFVNHRGGDILLGVNNRGRVVGLPRSSVGALLKRIRNRCACRDVFSPTVDVRIEVGELWKRQIVRIHVEPNPLRVSYKGVPYVRLGESDCKAMKGESRPTLMPEALEKIIRVRSIEADFTRLMFEEK